jgi:hypothetical protein
MCTSAKKRLLTSPVIKPRLRLGQKTQTRTKKMQFLALIHKYLTISSQKFGNNIFETDKLGQDGRTIWY